MAGIIGFSLNNGTLIACDGLFFNLNEAAPCPLAGINGLFLTISKACLSWLSLPVNGWSEINFQRALLPIRGTVLLRQSTMQLAGSTSALFHPTS